MARLILGNISDYRFLPAPVATLAPARLSPWPLVFDIDFYLIRSFKYGWLAPELRKALELLAKIAASLSM